MKSGTEPRRVALLIHGLGAGGAQQIVKYLVRWGDRSRLRYFVYCALGGLVREDVEAAGATVRIFERKWPKIDPPWAGQLARAMKKDGIELVHTHLFGDSLHGLLAARRAGRRPVVMTLHAKPDVLPALQRWGYRFLLLGRATRVVACSESTASAYLEAGWPGAEGFQTITNGIEDPQDGGREPSAEKKSELRRELGLDPEATVFATVGRLEEEKGYPYLIRAFARLLRGGRQPGPLQLVLVGGGSLEQKLRDLARAEGVASQVIFAGFRSNVRELLPAVDVVVFSSFSEGLSVALLEAMAASRPVIGTEVAGILEAVRPDREALIVPVRSVGRLSEALGRMAADPGLRSKLGESARQRFLESYTAERMVRDYEAMYEEVLGNARSAAA